MIGSFPVSAVLHARHHEQSDMPFATTKGFGAWFGTDLRRWRERGFTPLWLVFSATEYGCSNEAREALHRAGLDDRDR